MIRQVVVRVAGPGLIFILPKFVGCGNVAGLTLIQAFVQFRAFFPREDDEVIKPVRTEKSDQNPWDFSPSLEALNFQIHISASMYPPFA
jgi:hypothetical protein